MSYTPPECSLQHAAFSPAMLMQHFACWAAATVVAACNTPGIMPGEVCLSLTGTGLTDLPFLVSVYALLCSS